MNSLVKRMAAGLTIAGLVCGLAGCDNSSSAKKPQTKPTVGAKKGEADKPRVEEKYGYTTDTAGGD